MASQLAEAIKQSKAVEWDKNERALADQLSPVLPAPPELDAETIKRVTPFLEWARTENVRHAPAKPVSVAAFVLDQTTRAVKREQIFKTLEAVEVLHAHWNFSNPVATAPVRFALAELGGIEPPRSWRADEKLAFAALAPEVQAALSRREADRDRAMRRAQNEAADRKRQSSDADQSTNTEKENDNG